MNHAPALMLACATIALTLALLLPACRDFFFGRGLANNNTTQRKALAICSLKLLNKSVNGWAGYPVIQGRCELEIRRNEIMKAQKRTRQTEAGNLLPSRLLVRFCAFFVYGGQNNGDHQN